MNLLWSARKFCGSWYLPASGAGCEGQRAVLPVCWVVEEKKRTLWLAPSLWHFRGVKQVKLARNDFIIGKSVSRGTMLSLHWVQKHKSSRCILLHALTMLKNAPDGGGWWNHSCQNILLALVKKTKLCQPLNKKPGLVLWGSQHRQNTTLVLWGSQHIQVLWGSLWTQMRYHDTLPGNHKVLDCLRCTAGSGRSLCACVLTRT
jgi:hypothetical protein